MCICWPVDFVRNLMYMYVASPLYDPGQDLLLSTVLLTYVIVGIDMKK